MKNVVIEIHIVETDNPAVYVVNGNTCATPAQCRAAVVETARAKALEVWPKPEKKAKTETKAPAPATKAPPAA